ncbi:uncharacterized protein LOC112139698 isoform X2 [Oryzias melastigma]|uniref:uncharacterized protein LOC112139698 isoform X2 n=1 Tax=Oryzias melastigma TaxID=30732 RepID=UPI00168CE1B7|nr:uncharacterized protein LOC112139698 isoform X2 [Oryzias melastigma]
MGKVKEEIDCMEKMDVITRIEDPTDWCAGMVVVPKKSGAVRICVDFTKMNQAVCREKYILPSVEHTLGMLAGATVFSKLDANMGFWQVPLTEDILVWGKTQEEHDVRLHALQKAGITLNIDKFGSAQRLILRVPLKELCWPLRS